MKALLTFVFLLAGLLGYTQTNSHQEIVGHIYLRGSNLLVSNNDVQIMIFEIDTITNNITTNLSGSIISQQSNFFRISLMTTPTKPIVILVKPINGSRIFNKYENTWGTSSLDLRRATKIIIPSTPLGTQTTITQDVWMIPKFFRPQIITD